MQVSAPGKVVLFGEYAVLDGAPATVMAVNAHATCDLVPSNDHHWHFSSSGFVSEPIHCIDSTLPDHASAGFVAAILTHWGINTLGDFSDQPLSVHTDTTPFFHEHKKLGLGSSAATCTATYIALAETLNRQTSMQEALNIHRAWQGGKGSGLDVASCWHGGVIRFQNAQAKGLSWPEHLHWQIVWSGTSAATTDHIGHFDEWRQHADLSPLNRLCELSNQLCNNPTLELIAAYQSALMDLDNAAKLKIFSAEHRELVKIAAGFGLVYKPCGAGGGDIGIAFADTKRQPKVLDNFRNAATTAGFYCPTLEMAQHGVRLAQ